MEYLPVSKTNAFFENDLFTAKSISKEIISPKISIQFLLSYPVSIQYLDPNLTLTQILTLKLTPNLILTQTQILTLKRMKNVWINIPHFHFILLNS